MLEFVSKVGCGGARVAWSGLVPRRDGLEWSGSRGFQGVAEANLGSRMWTPTPRERSSRTSPRSETDLTHAEWALIEPHLPCACGRGRPRSWCLREILNGIFSVLRGGIAWRRLPKDLPPWQSV